MDMLLNQLREKDSQKTTILEQIANLENELSNRKVNISENEDNVSWNVLIICVIIILYIGYYFIIYDINCL